MMFSWENYSKESWGKLSIKDRANQILSYPKDKELNTLQEVMKNITKEECEEIIKQLNEQIIEGLLELPLIFICGTFNFLKEINNEIFLEEDKGHFSVTLYSSNYETFYKLVVHRSKSGEVDKIHPLIEISKEDVDNISKKKEGYKVHSLVF